MDAELYKQMCEEDVPYIEDGNVLLPHQCNDVVLCEIRRATSRDDCNGKVGKTFERAHGGKLAHHHARDGRQNNVWGGSGSKAERRHLLAVAGKFHKISR